MPSIPKIIHIVWIGGSLPQRNQACVKSFNGKNPDWTIYLWYDPDGLLAKYRHKLNSDVMGQHPKADHDARATAGRGVAKQLSAKADKKESFDEAIVSQLAHATAARFSHTKKDEKRLVEQYKTTLRDEKDENLQKLMAFASANNIVLKSVEEFGYGKDSPYTIEMRQRGNFGALSDIVRIDAILKYGGVYFDTDVECRRALGKIDVDANLGRFSCTHPGIAAQLKSSGTISRSGWKSDGFWRDTITGTPPGLVNSIIAAHPQSEMLKAYRSHIKNNYKEVKKKVVDYRAFYSGVRSDVISRTGPGTLTTTTRETAQASGSALGRFSELDESLEYKLWFRDTIAFPMYKVVDKFYHDWL